jgi:hypothetical protein
MLHRKFAVIKLWPKLKTAEDECIARLKVTAKSLGLECVEVDSFARLTHPPYTQLTQDDVDFVLSLHFETPKRYDIFSFVALWNPLQFFHEWGYRRFTRNLLTHDDFLSCSSPWADDHVKRLLGTDPMRDGPCLRLYHSLSEPIFPPTTGSKKLFYAGINWERTGKKKPGRHHELLKLLDESGDLQIYGPRIFQGVDVWGGYKSYIGPVPFDGVSMVRMINKAGISLVLSSEAHRQSELMSSRLFESLAAGAVVICDENPFARRFFGDTLLYIDTTLAPEEVCEQVKSHLDWIRSEPAKAQELAKRAQEIFLRDFTLDRCLAKIYEALPERKKKLELLYSPIRPEEAVRVIFLMPDFQPEVLEQHIASCLAQKNVNLQPVLAMDAGEARLFGKRVRARLDEVETPITLETVEFAERYSNGSVKRRRQAGRVINDLIKRFPNEDYLCIAGPHERLFSDHLCSLVRVLQDCDDAGAAWSEMLLLHRNDHGTFADLNDMPDVHGWYPNKPLGFGRFLFRRAVLGSDLETTLPYLDALSMHLLVGIVKSVPSKRCTVVLDIQHDFNMQFGPAAVDDERELLIDYAPALFRKYAGSSGDADHLEPLTLSLDRLKPGGKTKLAVELAHSVPFPAFLKRIGFGLYRLWLRTCHSTDGGK